MTNNFAILKKNQCLLFIFSEDEQREDQTKMLYSTLCRLSTALKKIRRVHVCKRISMEKSFQVFFANTCNLSFVFWTTHTITL